MFLLSGCEALTNRDEGAEPRSFQGTSEPSGFVVAGRADTSKAGVCELFLRILLPICGLEGNRGSLCGEVWRGRGGWRGLVFGKCSRLGSRRYSLRQQMDYM